MKVAIRSWLSFSLAALALLVVSSRVDAAGEPTGPMAAPRTDHAAARLPDGRVLVVGGSPAAVASTAEIYDPLTGTFSLAPPLSSARSSPFAVTLTDGRVLVGGTSATAEVFDASTPGWTVTGPMINSNRYKPRALALPDGRALIVGGDATGTCEIFDPATGNFTATGSLVVARGNFAAVVLADGRVVVAGGYLQASGPPPTTVETWDPASGTWSITGSIALARIAPSGTLLANGKVLIAGGTNTAAVGPTELYDPATGTTTTSGSLNVLRYDHAAALLGDGSVVVSGGTSGGLNSGAYERYDIATGTWQLAGPMVTTRNRHTATSLANGDILVAGGSAVSTTLASAEIVDLTCIASPAVLNPASASFPSEGGSGSIAIAKPAGCSWRVSRLSGWITLTTPSEGVGDGTVGYTVAANASSSGRGQMLSVADNDFTVSQAASACFNPANFSLSQSSWSVGYLGAILGLGVTAPAGCPWTVSNLPSWVTTTPSGGTGNQVISVNVAANSSTARSASITIANNTFTVNQATSPCIPATTISPASQSIGIGGGSGSVTVTAGAGCGWNVLQVPSWITIASFGTGSATLSYTVAANSGVPRSATLNIGGNSFTVSQAGNACVNTQITPDRAYYSKYGGTGSVSVTTNAACSWSVASVPAWITVTSPTSGTGNGTVAYTVSSNPGVQRSATMSIAGFNHAVTQAAVVGGTEPTGSMTNGRYGHGAAVLPDGRVLVAGGFTTSFIAMTATAEIYDPAAGTFAGTGSMLQARATPGFARLADGRVLAAGGVAPGDTALASAEIYNPATGAWSATGSMATARRQATALTLADGRVLVIGGDGTVASVEVYDPSTGTFAPAGSLLAARGAPAVALLADGRVFIAGGFVPPSTYLSTTEIYDPATGTSVAAASMTAPRSGGTATLLANGKVLVAGGNTGSGWNVQTQVFDPVTGLFSASGNLLYGRGSHAAVRLADGSVVVTGGSQLSPLANERFDPSSGTWRGAGAFFRPRSQHSATLLADGKVLVAGGDPSFGSGASATAEIYDPGVCVNAPTVSPSARTFLAGGGTGTITVTLSAQEAACTWTVANVPSWITITSGASGTGSGTVSYTVPVNTGAARNVVLNIAGATSQVSQSADMCSSAIATLTPSSQTFTSTGGSGSFSVSYTAGCPWSVSSVPSWITITSGASGVGSGTVAYTVAPNADPTRNATLSVAGRPFTATQYAVGASPCDFVATLVPGTSYSGALSTTDCKAGARGTSYYVDRYQFTASPGQQVAFLVTGSFDTYMYLRNPAGTVIASDDDGGGGVNSRIPSYSGVFTIPSGSSGTYVIEVTSYSSNATGSYTLQRIQ